MIQSNQSHAENMFKKGFRATVQGNDCADYFELTTPDGTLLKFEDRFDEPTGVCNDVLGFTQTEGPQDQTTSELNAKVLTLLSKMQEMS